MLILECLKNKIERGIYNMKDLEKLATKLVVKTTLGKDGKTYKNLVIQFIDLQENVVFSLQVQPTFKMTSSQFGLYSACINSIEKEQI